MRGSSGRACPKRRVALLLTQLHALELKTWPCALVPVLRDHIGETANRSATPVGQAGARRADGVSEAHGEGSDGGGAPILAPMSRMMPNTHLDIPALIPWFMSPARD